MALKWGILSAGKISRDFVNAMGTLDKNEHQIIAVAARDLNRAQEFAKRFDIPKAYSNYLALAQDPDIEVVYVGSLHTQHLKVSMLMLEHGKHVLCEKPLCMNEKQTQQLIAYAKQKKLFLMEAIWSRCFPSYQYIREQIESGNLGTIQSVDVEMGVPTSAGAQNIMKKSLGGGTVLNMSVYPIQFCQLVFKKEPQSIKASGKLNDDGIDLEMSAELNYGGNKVGKIKTSVINPLSNTGKIIGSKGVLTVPAFWNAPSLIAVDDSEKSWPFPKAKYEFIYENSCGLRYEAEEVRKCIRAGKKECELVSHDESITIARIEDEIRKQIGVKYPEDD